MNNKGIGLVEILISLTLACFIIILEQRHYLSVRQQYSNIKSNLERNIEVKFITDLIRSSIRQAGFTPCLGIENLTTIDDRNYKILKALNIIAGSNSVLQINHMSTNFDMVKEIKAPELILTTDNTALNPNALILISDCYHAEVKSIIAAKHIGNLQLLTLTSPLNFIYHDPIYIGEWIEEKFYTSNQENLNYYFNHAEELTDIVKKLTVNLIIKNGRKLLSVVLTLDNDKSITIDTMVRIP